MSSKHRKLALDHLSQFIPDAYLFIVVSEGQSLGAILLFSIAVAVVMRRFFKIANLVTLVKVWLYRE
ncbi:MULTISPECIES: hypothetical protein [Pacificibacter]|uniref:hypothetical protein n=1 Tax=Pacificibacter TaxID=1042323 RepID=UPI001C09EBB5|nr:MULTISPECIES: hypothetical protein [Pacificibacter]MBU2936277.1 hypothetical protein [Pacificibacter marinus]MDO6616746.1 hypothetical protein [Pacificibacter sp. 1_MG-2023]